ncbi:MAG: TlpA family protein disulfide reductase [Acetatifactor sp.]
MKRTILLLTAACLLLLMAGCQQGEPVDIASVETTEVMEGVQADTEKYSGIAAMYEELRESYLSEVNPPDPLMLEKILKFEELHRKAYDYCTDCYYVQTDLMINGSHRVVKTYVQKGNVRWEQWENGAIAYVEVYNAEEDIFYSLDVERNDVRKVTNAAKKGRSLTGYEYGYCPWMDCNARNGVYSQTELNGRKAALFDCYIEMVDEDDLYNAVWFDEEYGIPIQFQQGDLTEEYLVIPRTSFDESVFAFDADNPACLLELEDIQACAESQNTQTPDSGEAADSGLLSMETLKKIPDFTSVDMDGNEITNDIFSDYKLTLVNLWGTWCNPCVAEMPKLQMLYDKYYSQGLNIIGITEDATGNEDLVQQIVQTNGVTYTILYPDAQFYDDFVSICFAFPTSVLVDSEGNVLQVFQGDPGFDALDAAVGEILSKDPKGCIS